jgi:rare lipoprotein A
VSRVVKLLLLICVLSALFALPAQAQVSCYGWGDGLAGNLTSSGEPFDPSAFTAASPYLPFGSLVAVTDPESGNEVVVRITDRGPFAANTDLDMA